MMTAYNEKVGGLITKLQEKAEKTNTDVYTQYQIVLEETVREGEGEGHGGGSGSGSGSQSGFNESTTQPICLPTVSTSYATLDPSYPGRAPLESVPST